ncbi:MAG: hypothetical protein ACKN9S_15205, partial [Pirellula sp.]
KPLAHRFRGGVVVGRLRMENLTVTFAPLDAVGKSGTLDPAVNSTHQVHPCRQLLIQRIQY